TNIVARFPRYQELLQKRGGTDEAAITTALANFTEQDFRDLQVWFNLAWFDPMFHEAEPLKSLVEQGRDFSEADKVILFDEVRRVMAEVIPLHKQLQAAGQIQVITTPYAHPILPLIYNNELALVGNPAAEMPERYSYPNDAIAHLQKSVEIYKSIFDQDPVGLWPGEGAVAEEIVPLVSRAGYQWMATGEPVLAQSLGIGSFTRDSNETVQEADDLYRPYYVETRDGERVVIFFRDLQLSDKLGFTYSQTPGEDAAADLMQRLENIRLRLNAQGAEGPHIVSIILDGENAWENYPYDGRDFLNAMYRQLSESDTIKTVTPSMYLDMFPEQHTLDHLFPGAWFSSNYDTWIGEPEEKAAWNYLLEVREDLAKYDITKRKTTTPENLARALDYMYLAEGSDWFWWYGSDQESGVDEYFDTGFRALLAKVYESLGEPVPPFVNVPIIPKKPAMPDRQLDGLSSPAVDGVISEFEWDRAALYTAPADTSASALTVAIDSTSLYLRLDLTAPLPEDAVTGVYISTPGATRNTPYARSLDAASLVLLGAPASYLFEWDGLEVTGFAVGESGWQVIETGASGAAGDQVLELQIPYSDLGEVESGDDIRLEIYLQPVGQRLPTDGTVQVILPDLGLSTQLLLVEDREGDDHGPGTYTYPLDAVFTPQVFDIKNFVISVDDKNMTFRFDFFGAVPNPWGSGSNLSLQTLDVYIDKDPGSATGNQVLLPGRNAALADGNGWEYVVWAEGWTPAIYAPDPNSGAPKPLNTTYKIIADPAAQSVTLRVPLDVFGEGDPREWGYVAAVLSQDGYPATGIWRVRDVDTQAKQWRFGGGADDTNHTRIVDLVWSQWAVPTQEEMLTDYSPSQEAYDSLAAGDFAKVLLLTLPKE
ncbi:MAG: glycoside hydrolase, partial [Anaerolineae bacterium]|nr:glycoside hydrolase [Anaerolineae bacterium]